MLLFGHLFRITVFLFVGSCAGQPQVNHVTAAAPVDRDGDGISDASDGCPSQPEDVDGFEDGDGCADLDNDTDALVDSADKCPVQPEDKDGFEDDDGCPDPDNDGDGVLDTADRCPDTPEDKDGFQDGDGCADLDNDRDGIPDNRDQCVLEPEVINGNKDEDGCPDPGDGLVMLGPAHLELVEPIEFVRAKVAIGSFKVLGQLAATLRAHEEIVRVQIVAHVDPTANRAKDDELSAERARYVREWLVGYGIDAKRLTIRGMGGSRPLVKGGATNMNNRIEFIILEKK